MYSDRVHTTLILLLLLAVHVSSDEFLRSMYSAYNARMYSTHHIDITLLLLAVHVSSDER